MVRVRAPAKLNLHLEVLAQGRDGYHQLESVFCALELADELELESTTKPGVELRVEGQASALDGVPAKIEDNLVFRAAARFLEESGVRGGVRIRLRKHIPVGAGLGGGSSDAAATVLALDRMHREPLGMDGRLRLGAALGSDVPFFLCGSPLALAWGRGGRLLPLDPLPSLPVLLLLPEERMLTAEAFAALDRERSGKNAAPAPRVLDAGLLSEWDYLAEYARNDFEDVVFPRLPGLAEAKRKLQGAGAVLSLLTGSGSVVYGVFRDPGRMRAAALELGEAGWRMLETRTAEPAPPPPFG